MTIASFEKAIHDKIPPDAVSYCVALFDDHPFLFKLSKNRKSKSGDYRFDKRTNQSVVTVNSGLNPYSFLITLVHEMAHHVTRLKYNNPASPHGKEWKEEFKNLMLPLINPMVFPDELIRILAKHMKNPKASTWSDARLAIALRKYNSDHPALNELHLDEVTDGKAFRFNDRVFTKLEKRRTRVLCLECASGRKYLIPRQAVVTHA